MENQKTLELTIQLVTAVIADRNGLYDKMRRELNVDGDKPLALIEAVYQRLTDIASTTRSDSR